MHAGVTVGERGDLRRKVPARIAPLDRTDDVRGERQPKAEDIRGERQPKAEDIRSGTEVDEQRLTAAGSSEVRNRSVSGSCANPRSCRSAAT
jgi:hypothetical protein